MQLNLILSCFPLMEPTQPSSGSVSPYLSTWKKNQFFTPRVKEVRFPSLNMFNMSRMLSFVFVYQWGVDLNSSFKLFDSVSKFQSDGVLLRSSKWSVKVVSWKCHKMGFLKCSQIHSSSLEKNPPKFNSANLDTLQCIRDIFRGIHRTSCFIK